MKTKIILFGLSFLSAFHFGQVQTVVVHNNYSNLSSLQMLDNGNLIYDAKDSKSSTQVFSSNYLTGETKQLTDPCTTMSNYNFFAPFTSSAQPDGVFSDGANLYGIVNTYNNCGNSSGFDKKVFKTDGNTLTYTTNTQVALGITEYGGLSHPLKTTDGNPLLIGRSEKLFKINKSDLSFDLLYSASNSISNVDLIFVGSVNGTKMFYSNNNYNIYRFNETEKTMVNLVNMKTFYQSAYPNSPNSLFKPTIYKNNSVTNYVENVGVLNGYLYFWVSGNVTGVGNVNVLWKTNGTVEGTSEVKRFAKNNQPVHQEAVSFTNFNGELYFRFNDEIGNTAGLWKTNGTEAGTVLVKKLSNTTTASFVNFMSNIVPFKSQLFFLAKGDNSNYQVWKSDGTTTGTLQAFKVIDMDFANSNSLKEFKVFVEGDKLYFYGSLYRGKEIICSDGTAENTYSLGRNGASPSSVLNNSLMFAKNHIFLSTTFSDKTYLSKLNLSTAKSYILQNVTYSNGQLTIKADDLSKVVRIFFYNINSNVLALPSGTHTIVDNNTITYTLSQQEINYFKDKPFKVAVETESGTYLQKSSENIALTVEDLKSIKPVVYQTEQQIIIETNNLKNEQIVKMFDISGKLVYNDKFSKTDKITIPKSRFSKGVYILTLNDISMKIIIH